VGYFLLGAEAAAEVELEAGAAAAAELEAAVAPAAAEGVRTGRSKQMGACSSWGL
jgi:hypothetical protein